MVWPANIREQARLLNVSIEVAVNAAEVNPAYQRIFRNVNQNTRFDEIERANDRAFLYAFHLSQGDPEQVFNRFQIEKVPGTYLPACRARIGDDWSQILYVGSSATRICSRLRQHVRRTPRRTYALKLAGWFEGNHNWQADVYVRGYDGINREALQILEDATADALGPLFGKRGSNGR